MLQKALEYGVSTFHLFIDFKATYDTINREKLLEAMEEFNIPQKLIGLTRAMLTHVNCRVKMQNSRSESFRTSVGLNQGDALLCILLNLALEKVVKRFGDTK
jgi:sorting nexin-29